MSNLGTKQFYIDIQDVIVNAHPNLISCDQNVLIPNPVAPKVNIGEVKSKNPGKGGYLKPEQASYGVADDSNLTADKNGNIFTAQLADIIVKRNTEIENRIKNSTDAYFNLSADDSYYMACEATRKTFKTKNRVRDDLDRVINYLYYKSNEKGSASFPFDKDKVITRETKNGVISTITYQKYRYGYLKHIYISKKKIIELCKTENKGTDAYKDLISSILNVVNESVDNYWKFEIVQGASENGRSTISVVDKNTINFSLLQQIYTFELGSTNNVIKNINFDVSLTNEQATNVLFSGQNSALVSQDPKTQIQTAKSITELNATLNLLNNLPFIKFIDRLDKFQLDKLYAQQSGSLATLTPGATAGIESENNDIVNLQVYGSKDKNGILCMTFKDVSEGSDFESPSNKNNYKYLCLSSNMKTRLRQMLDDGDFKNNQAKYSGVADNFQVSITLDGIFSFRNLQCFAIKNLPKPYVPGNVIFQVLEVDHKLESGKWETVVNALVRCVGTSTIEYVNV